MEPPRTDLQEPVGLCRGCRHVHVVTARADNRYYRCERSARDPRYPKYPALPVLACPGYEPAAAARDPAR